MEYKFEINVESTVSVTAESHPKRSQQINNDDTCVEIGLHF